MSMRAFASTVGALVASAGITFASADASAQGWLKDRRYTEGEGIRAGDLELHPGIGGEIGYDSNWFLRSNKEGANIVNGAPNLPPEGAGVVRITPSFSLSTLSNQRLQNAEGAPPQFQPVIFRGGVSATFREFIGPADLRAQSSHEGNISLNADARVDINQGRPIGFGVFGGYQRLIQPNAASGASNPDLAFNRNDLRGGAEIIGIPGGGTLDLRGAYQIYASLFEESNGVPYNNVQHELSARNRWRFRPRTAVFHDTSLRFINYTNADRASNFLNDSTPLRTRIGLTGLVTDRFGTLLAVGYGATFFRERGAASPNYDSVNAQAEGTFYLGKGASSDEPGQASLLLSTVSIGFTRDFQQSYLANFYTSNKLYGRVEYWFGGQAVLNFDVYGEQLNYPSVFLNTGGGAPALVAGDFTNYRAGATLFAEYRFTSRFGINTTLDYSQMFSDTQIPIGNAPGAPPGTPQVFDLNWQRFQAFLGARYFL